jgi:hypothetical protein
VFLNRITRELSLGFDELEIQQFSVTTCTGTTESNRTCDYILQHFNEFKELSAQTVQMFPGEGQLTFWTAALLVKIKNYASGGKRYVSYILLHNSLKQCYFTTCNLKTNYMSFLQRDLKTNIKDI